jgi:hypothetical protein
LRGKAAKVLVIAALLLPMLMLSVPTALARVGLADANVTVLRFARTASSLQPASASGTVTVNSQTGTVNLTLQGCAAGTQLELLFAGVSSIVLGTVTVDVSGSGEGSFMLPPGQYSGSFQLISLAAVQMVTGQATFTIGLVTSTSSTSAETSRPEPPGLRAGWAASNITVRSTIFHQTLLFIGAEGATITSITLASSSNGQVIRNVASNANVAQVEFDHDGGIVLVIQTSARPAAVYADDRLLAPVVSTAGLNFSSNVWAYAQGNGMLTVYADPATVTLFYGTAPAPIPEFRNNVLAVTLAMVAVATIFILTKRGRKK